MERLDTASNLFLKNKRQAEVQDIGGPAEEILKMGFYLGMLAHSEFVAEISNLEIEESLEQIGAMENEVKNYLNDCLGK